MKKIAILTSGGDAPGMNSAIRSFTLGCIKRDIVPVGVIGGYRGLFKGEFLELTEQNTSGIHQKSGSMLKSLRFPEFTEPSVRQKAYSEIKANQIDALIVLGGDGSFKGAELIKLEAQIPIVGIPATIDNDILGTEYTLGFDTACNRITESLDQIQDTASAHERIFIIEVMGRHCGQLAHFGGLAGDATLIISPESPLSLTEIENHVLGKKIRGVDHQVIVITEKQGDLKDKILKSLSDKGLDVRFNSLGHTVRGGAPSNKDRVFANESVNLALDALVLEKLMLTDKSGFIAFINGQVKINSFNFIHKTTQLNKEEIFNLTNRVTR